MVHVIMERERINAVEQRLFVAFRQNQVPDDFRGLNLNGREGHAHLKSNAAFLRQDLYGPTASNCFQESPVKPPHRSLLASKMRFQTISTAEM